MKLQTKFQTFFALAALLSIGFGLFVVRMTLHRLYAEESARILEDAVRLVKAELEATASMTRESARALGDPSDRDVAELLVDLSRGTFDETRARELAHRAPILARERGLDILTILDESGRVLGCGQAPARVGDLDAVALERSRRHRDQPLVASETLAREGRLESHLVIETATLALAPDGDKRVTIIAGMLLDARLLERLHQHGRLEARLLTAPEGQLLGSLDEGAFPQEGESRFVDVPSADGAVRARLELRASTRSLLRVLSGTTRASLMAGSGALVLALVFGGFLARRVANPVMALSKGARIVAEGNLDVRLPAPATRDEVADLVTAFNTMTTELARSKEQVVRTERIAAWREIARRLAHELKNPLTPIQMAIETLERTRARPEVFNQMFPESVRTILEEVGRLKRIVGEFSEFARLPAPALEPCELGELVRSSLSLYTAAGVPLEQELSPEPAWVLADRQQVQQVLLNLLENARHAMDKVAEKGTITVRLQTHDGEALIEVEDRGIGFDPKDAERLFEPYFTTKPSGTGLGLAIARRIVVDHGGSLDARGNPGKGATFTVSLPRTRPPPA